MKTERPEPVFKEKKIAGQTYCLVPKSFIKFPSTPVSIEHIEGIGPVDISDQNVYMSASHFRALVDKLKPQFNLQDEISKCRKLIFSRYVSKSFPPFNVQSIKRLCQDAGAHNLFSEVMSAMSTPQQTNARMEQNEKKCVSIIFMLMFGQSQKANWFQRVLSCQVVGRGISESGLSILNKSGIAVSKAT